MTMLTTNEQAFITKMAQSEELSRHGFALLLKRADFYRFFQPLRAAGLFAPDRNPAPEPAPEQGYVRIPYWSALGYLIEISKLAGTTNDLILANSVMDIVRRVALWRDPQGEVRHNYHTAHKFTEIFGHLPTAAVTPEDVNFISTWLSDRFERMLVGVALEETVLPHFLESSDTMDWDKAVTILRHATVIMWVKDLGADRPRPRTVIEDHWLHRLLRRHVPTLATKRPKETTQVLLERVREVYSTDLHRELSTIYRPAIEDHDQNREFHTAENRTVEALRDALITWALNDPAEARRFLESLLADESEILRRIGVYVMNQYWPNMRGLYIPFLQSRPFTTGQLHELYSLLSNRFSEFDPSEQNATISALQKLTPPTEAKDPQRELNRVLQRWLSAIVGKGSKRADEWMATLKADPTLGAVAPHPDFDTYMTSWIGPGASPFSISDLVGFAIAHVLTDRLNSFEERDRWNGPTQDGLLATLQDAARTSPDTFLLTLSELLPAKLAHQQAVIQGLQQAWEAKEQSAACDWTEGWEQLIAFFEALIAQPAKSGDEGHKHEWLLAAVADCIRAGTQHDEHAFDPALLPRVQAIIDRLLQQLTATTNLTDDPMLTALNTPKGRAIEALFSEALRACRVADQAFGNHAMAWVQLQPVFVRELIACRNDNLEFSTLSGAYLAQLEYLNSEWTTEQIPQIFPAGFPANDQAAIAGLAYAAFTGRIYEHLLHGGIMDRALQYDLKGREAREKLIERIAAGYIWGMERLDSPRFQAIFKHQNHQELEQMTWSLWTLRHQSISDEQQRRILEFWDRVGTWAKAQTPVPLSLLSALSTLATYITTIDNRVRALLLAVAPHVRIGHHVHEFIEELSRLAEQNPDVITEVLNTMITAHVPEYDYQDTLQRLLKTLAAKGKKNEVLRMLDQLLSLPGMHDLYNELTRNGGG